MQNAIRKTTTLALAAILLSATLVTAQAPPASGTAAPAQKTIASTMSVYVFPTTGQDATQQSKDEAECYQWAVTNTGTDPFQLQKQQQAQAQQTQAQQQQIAQSGGGAGAKGAVKGAAAGALIGEIANDDAGEGAAYGAAAGVIAGRRRAKSAKKEAAAQTEQAGQQAQASTAQQMDGFKKAFSVCLEAKKYMVKY